MDKTYVHVVGLNLPIYFFSKLRFKFFLDFMQTLFYCFVKLVKNDN